MIRQKLSDKNKKPSSKRWLLRHINDPYVNARLKDGYRSRASYKLIEINNKYKLFSPGKLVADLGSAPGGWSQVIVGVAGPSNVWAVDLLPMEPIEGVTFSRGDFTLLCDEIADGTLDVVVSDMVPDFIGDRKTEHFRSMALCEKVLDFSALKLKQGGSLVMKIIIGGEEAELFRYTASMFKKTFYFKPKASSSSSSEMYVIAVSKNH